MNHTKKNKKLHLQIAITLLVIFILACLFWIYQDLYNLKEYSKNNTQPISEEQKNNQISTQKNKQLGAPRKISYLGRIREAKKLIEHDYFTLATIELNKARLEKPNFIEPYLILAEIYLINNDIDKLNRLIGEIQKKFPKNTEIIVLQTRKWLNEKKYQQILTILEKREDLPPTLKFYKAILLALQNDHITAKEILKTLEKLPTEDKKFKITQEGPLKEASKNQIYLSSELSNKIADLMVIYGEFTSFKEGENAHLLALQAKALAEHNELALAQEFANTSIKEDPQYIDAWIIRGYTYYIQKDYNNALSDFRHAYKLDTIRPEIHYFMALSLYENKQYTEAALFFEKSLEYDFEFTEEVQWKLLEIFTRQKKYDKVIEIYKTLLNEDTESDKFITAIYTVVDVIKKPEVALEFSQILLDKNDQDIFSINIHAWALIANKQYIPAQKYLEQAIQIDPKNPRTYLNLGLLYEEKGEIKTAKEMYKKTYEFGKKSPKNYTSLVNLAVDKFNTLADDSHNPQQDSKSSRPASAP